MMVVDVATSYPKQVDQLHVMEGNITYYLMILALAERLYAPLGCIT